MIETRFLDRIQHFDPQTGLLRAEPGISFLLNIYFFATNRRIVSVKTFLYSWLFIIYRHKTPFFKGILIVVQRNTCFQILGHIQT